MDEVTIGVDIGTTSVKAIAADGRGRVLASARVAHRVVVPAPDRLEHDAAAAWQRGVRQALAAATPAGVPVRAVSVAAMVPSLTAVSARGRVLGPGLLYGDERGRLPGAADSDATPAGSGEFAGFLRWLCRAVPSARGFWPAQAVANHALTGRAAVDGATAFCAYPLFDGTGWDPALTAEAGARPEQLPDVVGGTEAIGRLRRRGEPAGGGPLVGPGSVDALAAQLVAGADEPGDVLVLCGATLICWLVVPDWIERPGLWAVPHTTPGRCLLGGASNAGGIFMDWALRLAGGQAVPDEIADPGDVPVWLPYVRGERTPLHQRALRAEIHGLGLRHGGPHLRRAAFEAAGFVVRRHLDLATAAGGVPAPRRIVAVGGGTRAAGWMRALADCTGLAVHVAAEPDVGALGSAFVARCVAGLETQPSDGARWAATGRVVEPDPSFARPCADRYDRFVALTTAATNRGT